VRRKIASEDQLTIPEVKKILEERKETLDEFQHRTYDYVSKFSKLDADKAGELIKKLVEQFETDKNDAIQIANCMPSSIEELRVFFAGSKKKIIAATQLEAILSLLDGYR
jgi:DNA-directed RNA polymerase subunit F